MKLDMKPTYGHQDARVVGRFWSKVKQEGDCWIWQAGKVGNGYGHFTQGGPNKMILAHRWAYEHMIVEIPEGLFLDHLCRRPSCVNPYHLDPVTHSENLARSPLVINATAALRTHCPRGHEYTSANTRIYNRKRNCRACGRFHTADYRARRASAA